MTIIEAISIMLCDQTVWARPVSLKNSGSAFCIKNNYICQVPTLSGADLRIALKPEHIIENWEFVKPKKVITELS
jgi:hypothetical protein